MNEYTLYYFNEGLSQKPKRPTTIVHNTPGSLSITPEEHKFVPNHFSSVTVEANSVVVDPRCVRFAVGDDQLSQLFYWRNIVGFRLVREDMPKNLGSVTLVAKKAVLELPVLLGESKYIDLTDEDRILVFESATEGKVAAFHTSYLLGYKCPIVDSIP